MTNESYKNFLIDLVYEISNKENVFEQDTDLYKGYNFAIYEIMSLMVEQCENFGISLDEIGLENICLENKYL
ncbi:hypothetical protein [Neisseria weaveri]|uniref:hypothetical protein n=1 Tax=Neisseria weaveri TaxID=28091 RepID=UPI0007C99EB8|nr:hypothetical protein [Neisseria weaveri]SAY50788.1 Uncharacterised protein [Neisseria weaveri]